MSEPPRLSFREKLSKIAADVAEHGVSVVTVVGSADRQDFAYSVGLTEKLGHPEIIISGLPQSVAATLINDCAKRVEAGDRFSNAQKIEGLLVGTLRCEFRAVTNDHRISLFGFALAYYESFNFDALQLVWPDRGGRLPGEDGYHQGSDVQDLYF